MSNRLFVSHLTPGAVFYCPIKHAVVGWFKSGDVIKKEKVMLIDIVSRTDKKINITVLTQNGVRPVELLTNGNLVTSVDASLDSDFHIADTYTNCHRELIPVDFFVPGIVFLFAIARNGALFLEEVKLLEVTEKRKDSLSLSVLTHTGPRDVYVEINNDHVVDPDFRLRTPFPHTRSYKSCREEDNG